VVFLRSVAFPPLSQYDGKRALAERASAVFKFVFLSPLSDLFLDYGSPLPFLPIEFFLSDENGSEGTFSHLRLLPPHRLVFCESSLKRCLIPPPSPFSSSLDGGPAHGPLSRLCATLIFKSLPPPFVFQPSALLSLRLFISTQPAFSPFFFPPQTPSWPVKFSLL